MLPFLTPLVSHAIAVTLLATSQPSGTPSGGPGMNCPPNGAKVAFLGDSITYLGWQKPAGYVHLVAMALGQIGDTVQVIPAGVPGNTSKDMLARLNASVLSKKPNWMFLSCGVNDVWHGAAGVALDQYKENISSIVNQATAAGIKVVLLTATLIGEDPANPNNQKLSAYNDFLHALAKTRNLPIADLNVEEQAELNQLRSSPVKPKGLLLTVDGVHMNPIGDQMMATGVLKALGFTEAQLSEARKAWLDIPNGVPLLVKLSISPRQYEELNTIAGSKNETVDEVLTEFLGKAVEPAIGAVPLPSPSAAQP